MKRISPGTTEAFLRANVEYSGDDCLIWPYGKSKGYGVANVGGKTKYASHWMCEFVYGESPSRKHDAAHSCGNPACVSPRHLRWATKRENEADKEIHGTIPRGENHVNTNLTAETVRAIRADSRVLRIVAAEYGISTTAAYNIKARKRWRHLA